MKYFLPFIIIFSFASDLHAVEIKDVDMFGYARAGVGTNTYGGDQECFYNQGAGGGSGIGRNEFRLGNECSNYLEIGLRFNHVKEEKKKVYTQFRVANSHPGDDAFEGTNQSTNFVEAFAQLEGVTEMPWSFWAGKRFYREHDVHMDDYYYYGAMSGNGGGIGNIDLFGGKLALAYLKEISSTLTNIGRTGLTVYDARLSQVTLSENIRENFWAAFGHAPESFVGTTGTHYKKANGYIVGTLFEFDLDHKGFNHFAVMFGQGLMNNFNLYGDTTVTIPETQSSQKRLRFVNHTTLDLNEKWAFHASLNHERVFSHGETSEQWLSGGIRPMYRVTPTFHLVSEAGHSIVQNGGARHLTRVTFAPTLSINESIWGRPVLRAFYTHSFWNGANKTNVAANAPTYANKRSGGSYGLQMESFF